MCHNKAAAGEFGVSAGGVCPVTDIEHISKETRKAERYADQPFI
jgi:hypothetical protein